MTEEPRSTPRAQLHILFGMAYFGLVAALGALQVGPPPWPTISFTGLVLLSVGAGLATLAYATRDGAVTSPDK